jgi:D-alanyl-D-alanine carboxypeptidase
VTIRSLLQMTSPIPNYSETVEIGEIEVADLQHQFSDKDLIGFVDPGNGQHFPPATGWFYSNTNYILAGLIIEAASGMTYEQALTTMILEPLGLHDTYYANGPHPGPASTGPVMSRVPRALYMLQDCLMYQPEPCKVSTLAPLIGKDMRMQNRSWAAEAGAIISNPRDLALWIRALFEMRVVPAKQLNEMTMLVSNKTGLPLQEVSPDEPAGFGLGLGRFYRKEIGGAYWFYEGETLGFRTIFAYWPQDDLLITGSVNSRPPNGEDKFGPTVIGGAFMALHQAEPAESASKPATK